MKKIFLVIIPLIFISIIAGCNSSNNGYESITIENYQCSYSLEYPSSYENEYREVFESITPFSYLTLSGPVTLQEAEVFNPDTGEIQTVLGKRGTSSIIIRVSNSKIYFGESYSAADRIEALLEGQASWANFKLLNRLPLTVSGVQGEMVEYLVDRLMPIPVEDGKNLDYVCAVYFDYYGLLWEIRAECIQEMKAQILVDFHYIIQSFKIIR